METPRTPRRTVIALQSFPLFKNALEDLNSTIIITDDDDLDFTTK
jgi:hypothetical protein